MICAYFFGGGALFLVLSIYMQEGLGLSTREAALNFLPFAGALLVSSLISTRHVGANRTLFLRGGFVLVAVGMVIVVAGLATTSNGDARAAVGVGLALYALGQGFVSPVMFATIVSGVPVRSAGAASGVLSTCQQASSMLGVAVIGLVFSSALDHVLGPGAASRAREATATVDPARAAGFAHAATWALVVHLAFTCVAAWLAWRQPVVAPGGAAPIASPAE